MSQLALSYSETLSAKHQLGIAADETLRQAILRKLEITRQCGQIIDVARADLNDSEFTKATSFLDETVIKSYLRFLRANPSPIDDLANALHAIRLALQTSGALEFQGHGVQMRHRPNFFSCAESLIQSLAAHWTKFVRLQPLKTWRTATLEGFVGTLMPIEKILQAVHVELKHRQ